MIYVIQCIWIYITVPLCFGAKLHFQKNRKVYLILTFITFALVMGLRDVSVGVDTKTYAVYYTHNAKASWQDIITGVSSYGMEIGWRAINKLCSYVSQNYYFFQLVYSIIYCWLYARFIEKTMPNVFVAEILFLGVGLYLGAFNVQRQFLAMIILGNGYSFFKEKKLIFTVICFIFAMLIHRTAFIFVVALLIYILRNKKRVMRLIPLVILIVALNYNALIELGKRYIPIYGNYYANQEALQTASGVWIIWIIIIVISVYLFYAKRIKDSDYKVVCIFSLGYVACNIVGLYFNYFERLGLYFMPFLPVFFYNFGNQLKSSSRKAIYYTGIVLSFTAYYLRGCFTGAAIEYSTFIFK